MTQVGPVSDPLGGRASGRVLLRPAGVPQQVPDLPPVQRATVAHLQYALYTGDSANDDRGLPGYEVLQYAHSHLRPRTDVPEDLFPDGSLGHAGPDLLSYLRAEPGLTLVAYSPLLKGAYTRPDRLPADFDHPGTPARLAALREVAREAGATVNQVVLAWQIGGELPIVPLAGVSSVAQLEENLAAVDLELTPEQRARLDAAH
ncbi:hypothetical protein HDA41_007141 [Streptomyces caelestis]|uniref:NADP-dependent oxidoreductase domain-containing protein n=1 Tax=Streptomyces caelestis TaxID=36816 RepID=A0A7W9HBE8_9ACTN|nr:hypothetical protein [Streptomyces caelestis]